MAALGSKYLPRLCRSDLHRRVSPSCWSRPPRILARVDRSTAHAEFQRRGLPKLRSGSPYLSLGDRPPAPGYGNGCREIRLGETYGKKRLGSWHCRASERLDI